MDPLYDESVFQLDESTRGQFMPNSYTPAMYTEAPVEDLPASSSSPSKGKGVSRPLPILLPPLPFQQHDTFDISISNNAHIPRSASSPAGPSSMTAHYSPDFGLSLESAWDPAAPDYVVPGEGGAGSFDDEEFEDSIGKGKQKESAGPPSLPPLRAFTPIDSEETRDISWSVSTPGGLSSYTSGYINQQSFTLGPAEIDPTPTPIPAALATRTIRRHSYPESADASTFCLGEPSSFSRLKSKLNPSTSNLAKKLLARRRAKSLAITAIDDRSFSPSTSLDTDIAYGSVRPWPTQRAQTDSEVTGIRADGEKRDRHTAAILALQRTQTAPSSVPLYVDAETPAPQTRGSFEYDALPTEVRLAVLRCLVDAFVEEHETRLREGTWDAGKASLPQNKWVGKEQGMRELLKFGQVSKSWRQLTLDGELWQDMHLDSFPTLPRSVVVRLSETAGPFVKSLDLSGNSTLPSHAFDKMIKQMARPWTQLTALKLRGCTFVLTSSLHNVLLQSPSLRNLCVRGIREVLNDTLIILGSSCPELESLDIRQCSGLDAGGLYSMAEAARDRGGVLRLKSLLISGLKFVNDRTMSMLGEVTPFLEVLDLSYSRHLHNSALEAFVACDVDTSYPSFPTVLLHASEVGRDSANGPRKYRRRVTKLRHLNLSSCRLLTDTVCSNLAHSVPELEFLELAGLGEDLKDEGLCRLLATTPKIKRLDLEDATALTDGVLAALTPPSSSTEDVDWDSITGHALEQLVMSHVREVTDSAMQLLIRRCKRLTVLEVDNTRLSGSTLQLFVRKTRKRQIANPRVSFVDCRNVSESLVKDISASIRPRLGWRAYDARHLMYLDNRDEDIESLGVGQDECDERRVVVKTYYSWQTVDAVCAALEKKKKAASRKMFLATAADFDGTGRGRWWTPIGGRRSGGNPPPSPSDLNSGEGCTIM